MKSYLGQNQIFSLTSSQLQRHNEWTMTPRIRPVHDRRSTADDINYYKVWIIKTHFKRLNFGSFLGHFPAKNENFKPIINFICGHLTFNSWHNRLKRHN